MNHTIPINDIVIFKQQKKGKNQVLSSQNHQFFNNPKPKVNDTIAIHRLVSFVGYNQHSIPIKKNPSN